MPIFKLYLLFYHLWHAGNIIFCIMICSTVAKLTVHTVIYDDSVEHFVRGIDARRVLHIMAIDVEHFIQPIMLKLRSNPQRSNLVVAIQDMSSNTIF